MITEFIQFSTQIGADALIDHFAMLSEYNRQA